MKNLMIIRHYHIISVKCPFCGFSQEQDADMKDEVKQMKQQMRHHIKNCPDKYEIVIRQFKPLQLSSLPRSDQDKAFDQISKLLIQAHDKGDI